MALHNTQCPHCFTTYVISDEQLRVSEGMVRCGTCRERFQARIITNDIETPRFDPRDAFIEPLTDEVTPQKPHDATTSTEDKPQNYSFADPHTESEKSVTISLSDVSESLNSEMSLDIDSDLPVTPVDSKRLTAEQMLENIRAKQARERNAQDQTQDQTQAQGTNLNTKTDLTAQARDPRTKEPSDSTAVESDTTAAESSGTLRTAQKTQQRELSLPDSKQSDTHSFTEASSSRVISDAVNEEALIDQVDALVEDKLINGSSSNPLDDDLPFRLDQKPKKSSSRFSWLLVPPMLVIVLILIATLVYQLWMKQIVAFKSDSFAQAKIVELSVPIAKRLAEHDIVLPLRRNLSQLELVSARTEAHPVRSSTTLLRISIINHADIEQPLPWLEMSLTNAEGQLISRRALSPLDYVYQNATNDLIGARELKKITVELLSFPKQATGYELKILNK